MKQSKLIIAAEAAKKEGYVYLTSVVKSHFATTYHHVVRIDDVLTAGRWIPASCGQFESGAYGRFGVSCVPAKSINKSSAIIKYCKEVNHAMAS